jgi:ABC-2 type transport system ATP-binding protein
VHAPKLLILDEPMSGLDPFGRRDVRELILEQRERGTTVLLSSHILPDVEALCDRVAIVLGGRIERIATVGEIVRGGTTRVEIRIAGRPLLEIPPDLGRVLERSASGPDTAFMLTELAQQQDALAWLLHAGARVLSVTPMRSSLEDLFMATAERAGTEPSAVHARASASR